MKSSAGRPVTASDFKWSWERALAPNLNSERARETLGNILGTDAVIEGRTKELAGVEAIDDRILRVTLSKPNMGFLMAVADPAAVVLKRQNVENWGGRLSNGL